MIKITFELLNLHPKKDVADWVCEVFVDSRRVYYSELVDCHAKESWRILLERVADDIKVKDGKKG